MFIAVNGGSAVNDPTMHSFGMLFTDDQYVDITGNFASTDDCTYAVFWLNLIQGVPGFFGKIGLEVGKRRSDV